MLDAVTVQPCTCVDPHRLLYVQGRGDLGGFYPWVTRAPRNQEQLDRALHFHFSFRFPLSSFSRSTLTPGHIWLNGLDFLVLSFFSRSSLLLLALYSWRLPASHLVTPIAFPLPPGTSVIKLTSSNHWASIHLTWCVYLPFR